MKAIYFNYGSMLCRGIIRSHEVRTDHLGIVTTQFVVEGVPYKEKPDDAIFIGDIMELYIG